MSNSIDKRVVKMEFDNRQFESGVKTSLSTIQRLKDSLNFRGASKSFENLNAASKKVDMQGLGSSVESVASKFSAMGIAGITALANITNSAVNAGRQLLRSLTIAPIKQGFDEYELKMGSIQTIMMSTGASLKEVNEYLNELNIYADKTIYSFKDMTSNIGKFTNSGVALKDAVMAIQGVSNVAAVSGANANEASRAMYNFAQALSAGYVKLIDWKSIENANMATVEFKTQLLESAVACGTLTKTSEGMYKTVKGNVIDATHGFNDSLQDQWMTTEALVNTLRDYADETTAIGKKAFAAAQDVKTFSQLIDTLQEAVGSGWAMTSEILFGDFEEAKSLWTSVSNVVGGFIDRMSDARNEMLQTWKDLGGRADLISGIKNIFMGLVQAISPIQKAFREIFPKTTGEQLHNLTTRFKELSETFVTFIGNAENSGSIAKKVYNTFSGLFSILSVGVSIIKKAITFIASATKIFMPLADSVLTVTGAFGKFVVGASNAVKASNGLKGALESLSAFVSTTTNAIHSMISKISPVLSSVFNIIQNGIRAVSKAFNQAFNGGSFLQVFTFINGGLLIGVIKTLKAFITDFTESIKSGGGVLSGIKDIFNDVRESLQLWQTTLKAKALTQIAISLGILSASIVALSLIDPKRLTAALAGITVLFSELIIALNIFSGIELPKLKQIHALNSVLISLSSALLILSLAMKNLSAIESEDMFRSLLSIIVLIGSLATVSKVLSSNETASLMKGATGMIAFAVGVKILASAVKDLSGLNTKQLMIGLAGIGTLLLMLTKVSESIAANSAKFMLNAAGVIALAAGIKLMVSAVSDLATINFKALGTSLLGLSGILAALSIFMKKSSGIGGFTQSATVLLLAVSLKILTGALVAVAQLNVSQIGKGLLGLGGGLAILAVGLHAMKGTVLGATALLVASSAIAIFAPAMLLLSTINLKGIGISLLAIAGTFAVLGASALILSPLIPAILGLSASLALLGVSVLAIGAGLTLLGSGIASIAIGFGSLVAVITSGTVSIFEALKVVIVDIGSIIPTIIKIIGDAVITFAKKIIEGAPVIAKAVITLLDSLIKAAISIIPRVVTLAASLIAEFLKAIASKIGDIVQAGIDIVLGLIRGIASRLGDIVETAIDLMVKFMNALADGIRQNAPVVGKALANVLTSVIQSAIGLIGGFVSGFIDAGKSLISGFIKGITGGEKDVDKAAKGVGRRAIDGTRKALDSHSPSKEFEKIGSDVVDGFVLGIEESTPKVDNATEEMVNGSFNEAIKSVQKAMTYGRAALKVFAETYVDMTKSMKDTQGINAAKAAIEDYAKTLYLESDAYTENKKKVDELIAKRKELRADISETEKKIKEYSKSSTTKSKERVKEYKSELKTLKSNLKDTKSELKEAKKQITEGTKEFIENQKAAFEDLHKSISESVKSSIDPMSASIDTQIDLFKKFETAVTEGEDALTSAGLLSNMESQVQGISKWNKQLEDLVDKGFAKGLIDQLKNMGPSASNYIQAFMTMTNEQMLRANEVFEQSSQLTASTLLKNFQDSLESAKQWANDLAILATRGLNQGMIEQLGKAGTGSADYVNAFMSMTGEQLKDFNASYAEYLKLPDSVADSVMSTFSFAGTDASKSFVDGLTTFASPESEQNQKLISNLKTTGKNMVNGLKQGAESKKNDAKAAATSIGKAVSNGFKTCISKSSGSNLGYQMCSGLVSGLEAGRSMVIKAAVSTAVAAYRAACEALDINSPSRKFMEIGHYADLGMAKGFTKYSFVVRDSATGVGEESLEAFKSSIAKIDDVINNDMDMSPMIRPVLSMDGLNKGISDMNSMLSNKTIDIGAIQAKAAKISNQMNSQVSNPTPESQNGQNGNVYTFTQNNYSPKALSRLDIYRQTKNQFSAVKGALGV